MSCFRSFRLYHVLSFILLVGPAQQPRRGREGGREGGDGQKGGGNEWEKVREGSGGGGGGRERKRETERESHLSGDSRSGRRGRGKGTQRGHIGLEPQSAFLQGGLRMQAPSKHEATQQYGETFQSFM